MTQILKRALGIALPLLLSCSCGKKSSSSSSNSGDSTFSGKTLSANSDSGGILTATVDPNASENQILNASESSSIKGSRAAFGPGSLNVNGDVTIQSADSLASKNTNADLGIADSSSVNAASATVLIEIKPHHDPVKPFTLQIPLGNTLYLATETRVLYKIQKAGSPGTYFLGFIPASELTIKDEKVVFQASYFGAYQLVTVSSGLGLVSEVQTVSPPIPTTNQFPISGTWKSTCQACRNNVQNCYEIDTFVSSGSSITLTLDHYADASCTTQGDRWEAFSTYSVGGSVDTPAGASAVDVYATKFIVTPTSIGAPLLNSQSLCGKTDWAANTAVDITGNKDCNTSNPDANSAGLIYSNFIVTASTFKPGVPLLSNVDDGTTEAKRMKGSDTVVFTK